MLARLACISALLQRCATALPRLTRSESRDRSGFLWPRRAPPATAQIVRMTHDQQRDVVAAPASFACARSCLAAIPVWAPRRAWPRCSFVTISVNPSEQSISDRQPELRARGLRRDSELLAADDVRDDVTQRCPATSSGRSAPLRTIRPQVWSWVSWCNSPSRYRYARLSPTCTTHSCVPRWNAIVTVVPMPRSSGSSAAASRILASA